jgi:hypothetical protein
MRVYVAMRRGMLLALCAWLLMSAPPGWAQAGEPRAAEFRKRAAELVEQRRNGLEEPEENQEKALALLDSMALDFLNARAPRPLAEWNAELRKLVTLDPPLGEGFELILLGQARGGPACYALLANFGISGPSAVRLYASSDSAGGFRLAARIDRFAQEEFFDEYLELVPLKASDVVFVTVAGRTDELMTGSFAAWRYVAGKLEKIWSSDLLEHSSYEAEGNAFVLTRCETSSEQDPRACAKMVQERFSWDGVRWKLTERRELSPRPR